MKCAYCGKEGRSTREHIISCSVLDLFPECYITFDTARNVVHQADPIVKDVCENCNNNRISYIDNYAKSFISKYCISKYKVEDIVEIEYDYVMVQKMLLKYAFNDMRSRKDAECSFFDEEMINYLVNENDNVPKQNISVLCGVAINVSPVADAIFGNLKLRWCKNPFFYANTTIRNIDYNTGHVILNENIEEEKFRDLKLSYLFRFNSLQFLLMCWDKHSDKIEANNVILKYTYPYYLMNLNNKKVKLPQCTNEVNYHRHEHIHVSWDGLFEVGMMRKYASVSTYAYKEQYEKEWGNIEKRIAEENPR